jgi:hypothetical protein
MRRAIGWAAVVLGAALPAAARAEHAKITLEVEAGGRKATAHMDQTPPESGKNPRPVIKVKAGEKLRVKFELTNIYPHKTLEDVLVHFYVARIDKVGQKALPDLRGDGVVVESGFEMDFKPNRKAAQWQTLRVDAPGVYLVRVETKNTQSDHEHFSAIDLVVEKPDTP